MSVSIEETGDSTFLVTIDDGRGDQDHVHATVTSSGADVEAWIDLIQRIHRRRLHHLVVGLDVEWRPNFGRSSDNPVAVLQLCVGRRCLVFQVLRSDYVPGSLSGFLADGRFTFVGVGIGDDVEKLEEDWELRVGNAADLRDLVVGASGRAEMAQMGLVRLAAEVMGLEGLHKPRQVRLSRWDNPYLNWDQIKYAVTDAFLSFEIGRRVIAGQY